MHKKYIEILVLILTVLFVITGCTGNGNSVESAQDETTQVDTTQDDSTQDESIQNDTDKIVEDYWAAIASEDYSLDARIEWMDTNLSNISPVQASAVLTEFDQKHQSEAFKKMDILFNLGFQDLIQSTSQEAIEALEFESKPLKEVVSYVFSHGYHLVAIEGSMNVIVDYAFYEPFLPYVTEDIAAYYTLMAIESSAVPLKDAAVVIPWQDLFNRTLDWETFLLNYPKSSMNQNGQLKYKWYRDWSINGAPNTPIFDYSTKQISESYQEALMLFIKSSQSGSFSESMQTFAKLLINNQYVQNKEIEDFQKTFITN